MATGQSDTQMALPSEKDYIDVKHIDHIDVPREHGFTQAEEKKIMYVIDGHACCL